MATLTVQDSAEGGGISVAAAAGGGDVFANNGRTCFLIVNGGGGAVVVTATAQDTSTTKDGFGALTKADAVQSVEAGTSDLLGPFPKSAFNNTSGQVAIGYDGVTSVSVAAISINPG